MSSISFLKKWALLSIFIPMLNIARGQVSDDFSDGDFSASPVWSGDEADFEVDGAFELHLNAATVDNESYLSTPSEAINSAVWEIKLRMEFNPSSTSKTQIYLTSSSSNLEGELEGYYVMVGDTPDDVSLYRQDGGNSVKIIDGLDDVVDLSTVNVTIRVTRDDTGNWDLLRDVDNTGVFTSEGQVNDDTYSSSAYFGVLCDYIASRSDLFYFDDVNVTGTGFVDVIAPELEEISAIDNNTLRLIFNEEMDESSSSTLSSFTWNSDNPIMVTVDTDTVWLDFASDFPFNIPQSLNITGVTDLAGNVINSTDVEFTYLVFGQGVSGSIVINELMADPTPPLGLPEEEFIELFNASDSAFDLLNWNLRNSAIDEFLNSYILLPGEYVIICDDAFEAEFSVFGEVLTVSSLTALSNGGDDLYLFNSEGELVDEVAYSTEWYGGDPFSDGGYSLERINPFLACSSELNWGASQNSLGGTPGTENSTFESSDAESPLITNSTVEDNSTIRVFFNEVMDELSLILGSYILTPSATLVPSPSIDLQSLSLNISPSLTPGESYSLTVNDITDCSGNPLEAVELLFLIPEEPESGDIIFNELMPDPSPPLGLPDEEYIELLNTSNKILSLSGWTLVNSTSEMPLPDITMLPGDILILCHEDVKDLFEVFGETIGLPLFTGLTNSSDDLYLLDNNAETIDQVIYDLSWYNDASRDDGGYSMELINPELPCSDGRNWRASLSPPGGTPGQVNSALDLSPDIVPPSVTGVLIQGTNQALIELSEPIEEGSLTSENFLMTPSRNIGTVDFLDSYNVLIGFDTALDSGVVYTLTVSGIMDCSGNSMSFSQDFPLAIPEIAQEGDLIINEILFNPRTGGVDFVELYNRSPRPISLKNWKLSNIDSNGALENVEVITENELVLLPSGFMYLTEDPENIRLNYPLSSSYSGIEMADFPSLADDEGDIILVTPSAEVHDAFYYSDDYHFALIDDVNGVSLERVDYERLTNDPTNWHSAAENIGWATPGYENSQLQPSNNAGVGFTLEPEVFSPDNDGYEDLLHIHYALDNPGQIANISIFDREGRLVRLLSRSAFLGAEGTISWDGINEDGRKARIGVYVVLIELFDLDGNVSSTKKTCVLGGRL